MRFHRATKSETSPTIAPRRKAGPVDWEIILESSATRIPLVAISKPVPRTMDARRYGTCEPASHQFPTAATGRISRCGCGCRSGWRKRCRNVVARCWRNSEGVQQAPPVRWRIRSASASRRADTTKATSTPVRHSRSWSDSRLTSIKAWRSLTAEMAAIVTPKPSAIWRWRG